MTSQTACSEHAEGPEEWCPLDGWEDGAGEPPEGVEVLLRLAPLMPSHLLLPVLDRLGVPVVDALHQPWLEVRSDMGGYDAYMDAVECPALIEAVLARGDPELVRELLWARPLAGHWSRVADGLNRVGGPQLAEVAAELYADPDATAAIRHSLARGPLGPAMAACLAADGTLSPRHLRPLLATGDPEVARHVLALPPGSVTRDEQALAAMSLLEQGHGEDLVGLLRPVPEQGGAKKAAPGAHIAAELAEAFADGVPASSDAPGVAALRRIAEEAHTPRRLAALLTEQLTGKRQNFSFVRHSPQLHDLNALAGVELPRTTRDLVVSKLRNELPAEFGLPLLDHRDAADDPDTALVTPRQALEVASRDDVIRHTAPVHHLAELLDPTRDRSAGRPIDRMYGAQLDVALRAFLEDMSPEALLGAARLGPGFDGTLPELLDSATADTGTTDLPPEGIELLHLLLHSAPAGVVPVVLSRVSAQDALGLAWHAAVRLSHVQPDDRDEDGDLRPYRSVLCALARVRTDPAVRDVLAETAVQAAGVAGLTDAAEELLAALDAGGVPVREPAARHLPGPQAWLAQSERRRRTAREEWESPEVALAGLTAAGHSSRRARRPGTPIAWEEVVSHYRGGGRLAEAALAPLLHRPDLPEELRPLLPESHPELRTLPLWVTEGATPPRWLLREALPHWDRTPAVVRSSRLTVAVERRLVGAAEVLGLLAPAPYAAEVLESAQHVVPELAPRCRELVGAHIPQADAAAWTAAVRMLAGGFSGTLLELLTAAAARASAADGTVPEEGEVPSREVPQGEVPQGPVADSAGA
ncbi:hypothetical protein DVA86_00670 [Streptomyces armeniacus]|uniref:Uncharacterized protein n=1 Tax=Streptomyces armeniacus TaxID=83291 RepID=A0A345XIB0_9ACTN|nr:hypothetical protein [Streptomyces armeniacus]AXK31376.1 hypothetical protein DVA86_00670 [Streptomyces armeniacus]